MSVSNNGAQLQPETKGRKELGLSAREMQVLYLIIQGRSGKEIADALTLSLNTVKSHTTAVLRALNVTTRTQAVIAASRLGLRFSEEV